MTTQQPDFLSSILAQCQSATGGLSGRKCQSRYSPRLWERTEEGESRYYWGDGRECLAPIFLSKENGRDLPCGACSIREIECIEEAKRVKRMQEHMEKNPPADTEQYAANRDMENAIRALSMMIDMNGCSAKNVYEQAAREIKRENEWAEKNARKR